MVSPVNSTDFAKHRTDATSPIEPIKALIRSLDARIVQFASEQNWQNKERLEQLNHDHQQRILDLKTFRARLKENELGFPQDEIEVLDQQVKILTNQLREMHFYLTQLQTDPENAVRLIELRYKVFDPHSSHEAKMVSIQQIIAKLSHRELAHWLTQQFAKPEWYGWCYEPEQIEKTVNLINALLKTQGEGINYQQLQTQLLKHNATFLPFTRECITLLQPKLNLTSLGQDLDKIRDYFRALAAQVMTITNSFALMQKQVEPLVIRRLNTLQAIFDNYQQNIHPRAMHVHKIYEQVKSLQELKKGLFNCGQQLNALGDKNQLRAELSKMHYEEDTIVELLQLRDALLNSYSELESAISQLITQSSELRKDLSKDLNIRLPRESTMPEAQIIGDASDAFFDRHNKSIEEPVPGAPHPATPGQTRMDALLRASRRFSENLRSH